MTITTTTTGPRIHWSEEEIPVKKIASSNDAVVKPSSAAGDGSIFVSLVSYRDGERCGQTLKSIFETAKHPEKVFIGLVEQNTAEDNFCIEEYCKTFGATVMKRDMVREDLIKIKELDEQDEAKKCPHLDQIKLLAFHHYAAKGPIFARSLQRKLLGDQEFCLQLDAHTQMAAGWDEGLTSQWQSTQNEFGVISTIPPGTDTMDELKPGGSLETKVPRQCSVRFQENGIPDYELVHASQQSNLPYMQDVTEPLLSHAWSAAFSFSKCHLEEAVPYDPFLHFSKPIEQFGRYARMWTRGYDVYTPTRNYVFHDYGDQENGHGNDEWFKRLKPRFRAKAIDRTKLFLELPLSEESETVEADRANLGIYGLGQRRSLDKLQEFVNIKLTEKQGNEAKNGKCAGHVMVPYDASISPLANLHHEGVTKLDIHPIFPLRHRPVFATHDVASADAVGDLSLDTDNLEIAVERDGGNSGDGNSIDSAAAAVPQVGVIHRIVSQPHHGIRAAAGPDFLEQTNLPPTSVLFVLWIFGLIMWCFVFAVHNTGDSKESLSSKTNKSSSAQKAKQPRKTKLVKDV